MSKIEIEFETLMKMRKIAVDDGNQELLGLLDVKLTMEQVADLMRPLQEKAEVLAEVERQVESMKGVHEAQTFVQPLIETMEVLNIQ